MVLAFLVADLHLDIVGRLVGACVHLQKYQTNIYYIYRNLNILKYNIREILAVSYHLIVWRLFWKTKMMYEIRVWSIKPDELFHFLKNCFTVKHFLACLNRIRFFYCHSFGPFQNVIMDIIRQAIKRIKFLLGQAYSDTFNVYSNPSSEG